MREGLLHLLSGIVTYHGRCLEYLKGAGADEKLIEAFSRVPLYPARNIYEAILSWNFVMYLDNVDNLGCLAKGLHPYYKGEDVSALLDNLFDNFNDNGGYSLALDADYNELTYEILKASRGKRRPMLELFVDENTPTQIYKAAFEVIRTNNGQPAFYNRKILHDGISGKFPNVTEEDMKRFCGGGCTESMIAGLSNVGSLDAGIHMLYILEQVMGEKLAAAKSFEEFYAFYKEELLSVAKKVTDAISESRREREIFNPLPMRTLLVDDCIDRGVEYNAGGARYNWSVVNFAGMINVVDSMLVIRDFVFKEKRYTPDEFIERLKQNDESFLREAREHGVRFGNDNHDANEMARRISADAFSSVWDEPLYKGEGFLPASIQFMTQAMAGKYIHATPDGRCDASPLCDSLAAIFGKDDKGPTALLKSVTSLDLAHALGIPVVNFNISESFKDETLEALIRGYMALGGVHMQVSCASRETLLDAYEHPELHNNLVVRVGGYSEYFNRLSDDLKKMIINRSIH